MAETGRSGQTVSNRRRQQNVRAQKNYRERQKRHMEALEQLLASGTLNAKSGIISADSQITSPNATFQHSARASGPESARVTIATSYSTHPAACVPHNQQTGAMTLVTQIMGQTELVDEPLRSRIESGETTLQDILEAGLEALQLPKRYSFPLKPDFVQGGVHVSLLADEILVPASRLYVHSHSIPDIYASHLRIKKFSVIAAMRANAELLGIKFQTLLNIQADSPFYVGPMTKEDAESLISTTFPDVAQPLRPIASQLQYPHHPYVDLIPCPIFRERLVELISMDPPVVDEDELCRDFDNDGLICWGSQFSGEPGAAGAGAPWDIRSWEAQPWFLKKWWFLVGGAEGALFQQSQWWHEVRGDRLPCPW